MTMTEAEINQKAAAAVEAAFAEVRKRRSRREPSDENRFMQEWPDEVLNPPGLVGEVVRFIRDSSGMRQPKFALAAGLTVCGALIGRAVRDFTGQRTNLYTLAVGGTSAGKNDPIRAVEKLVDAMGAVKQENMLKADNGEKVLYLYGKIVENARRVALVLSASRTRLRAF